jgi:enoyl-CoA hydratase
MAVHIERDDAVAVVTVDRPEALNALNSETNEALLEAVRALSGDEAVRAVILTGAGEKSFVAGADIPEMKGLTVAEARAFAALGQQVTGGIEAAPQPWIAAVNGFALGGGCELALACDVRLASENAKFGQPEIGLGITPGFGGTQRLARSVGAGWAKYLVLSGRHIRADEALRIGLVQGVYPRGKLMAKARSLAAVFAGKSRLIASYCKAAVHASTTMELVSGLALEQDLFGRCFDTEDQTEGMTAYIEKRSPEFKGR